MIGRVVSGDSCRFKWSRTASVIIWRLYSYACRRARGLHSYMPHCKLHKLLRYAHFRFYQLHLKVLRSIFPPFNTFVRRKAWLQGSCRPRLRRHSHRRSQVSGSRGPLLLRRHTPTGFRMHSARRMRSFHRRSFRRSSCRGSGRRASRER
jgi:hypothetical protein